MKEEGVRIISFDSIIFIEALVIGGHWLRVNRFDSREIVVIGYNYNKLGTLLTIHRGKFALISQIDTCSATSILSQVPEYFDTLLNACLPTNHRVCKLRGLTWRDRA